MIIKKLSKIINRFNLLSLSVLFSLVNTQYSIAGLKEQYQNLEKCTSNTAQYYARDIGINPDGSFYTKAVNKNSFLCIINNQILGKEINKPVTVIGFLNDTYYYEIDQVIMDWRIENNGLVSYICDAYMSRTSCDDYDKISRLELGVKR